MKRRIATIIVDGGSFTGVVNENSIPDGLGVLQQEDYSLACDFTGAVANGKGELFDIEGNRFVGNFVNGEMNGYGEFFYENGNIFRGNFANDERSGYGEFILGNGEVSKGQWMDDNLVLGNPLEEGDLNINQPKTSTSLKFMQSFNKSINKSYEL